MRELLLQRVCHHDAGTFGVLIDDAPFAVTLEPEWRDNAVGLSCIPDGEYVCQRVHSPTFGNTFEITRVMGRTHILFHKGNWEHNTEGCVLVGESFEVLSGSPAIAHSGKGYGEFMGRLEGTNHFRLVIKPPGQ